MRAFHLYVCTFVTVVPITQNCTLGIDHSDFFPPNSLSIFSISLFRTYELGVMSLVTFSINLGPMLALTVHKVSAIWQDGTDTKCTNTLANLKQLAQDI